jgi:uncharacterized repeat protein (TIGR03899 family)
MDDLLGLGKSTDKLVSAVERALGAVYRPYGIKRDADAEAYRLAALERAKTDAKYRSTIELARAKVEAEIVVAEGKQELEARLQTRLQHEALRQQQNIESIVAGAMTQPQSESTDEEVDEDWLTGFFERAKTVSGAEMQALWSRVLTLEVGSPGTFSFRALDILRKLSRRDATAFQTACRLASSYSTEQERIRILCGGIHQSWFWLSEAPEIELGSFGFPLLAQMNLVQIGLIYEDGLVSGAIPRNQEIDVCFASTKLRLQAKRSGVKLQSYSLTPIGSELSALVAREEDSAYISALRTSLSKFFHVSATEIG